MSILNKDYVPIFQADKKIGYIYLLAKNLNNNYNLDVFTQEVSGECFLCGPKDLYYEILKKGSDIAYNNGYNIKWVDSSGDTQLLNYYPIMSCFLNSNNLTGNDINNWPESIKEYINNLKEYLYNKNIIFKYEEDTNSITAYINCKLYEYEKLQQKLIEYNDNTFSIFMEETYYLTYDGKVTGQKNKNNNVRSQNMKSYFDKSAFMKGLIDPYNEGLLLGDARKTKSRTKYYISEVDTSVDYLESIIDVDNSTLDYLKINGKFLTHENKVFKYDDYYNNKVRRCKSSNIEKGIFESHIEFSDTEVNITTNIYAKRQLTGENKDTKNIRNKILLGFPNHNHEGESIIKETYKLIDNNTRLLHYTSHSDFFEVYYLPNNFKLSDGLSLLPEPKVFNDKNYNHYDKSLKEIKEILNKKEKIVSHLKVKSR